MAMETDMNDLLLENERLRAKTCILEQENKRLQESSKEMAIFTLNTLEILDEYRTDMNKEILEMVNGIDDNGITAEHIKDLLGRFKVLINSYSRFMSSMDNEIFNVDLRKFGR